jgi:hypothetical protein
LRLTRKEQTLRLNSTRASLTSPLQSRLPSKHVHQIHIFAAYGLTRL